MVSNGGGSVTMQRDDDYRKRIMHSEFDILTETKLHAHEPQSQTWASTQT